MNFLPKAGWSIFAILVLGLLSPADTSAADADELRQMYVRFLSKKGWSPKVDEDGDVVFKTGDKTYFIDVHEKDDEFFMICLPNIWPIESATERVDVLKSADAANAKTMMAKVYTKSNNVWISVETFLADPRDFEGVFDRAFSAIKTATDNFVAGMK